MVHLEVRVKGGNTEERDILHSLELRTFKQTLSLLETRARPLLFILSTGLYELWVCKALQFFLSTTGLYLSFSFYNSFFFFLLFWKIDGKQNAYEWHADMHWYCEQQWKFSEIVMVKTTLPPTAEISADPPAVGALVNSLPNGLITEPLNHFLGFSTWNLKFKLSFLSPHSKFECRIPYLGSN